MKESGTMKKILKFILKFTHYEKDKKIFRKQRWVIMKVGDYVRTKYLGGSIEKIIEIIPKEKTPDLITKYATDISEQHCITITENEIIKSSPNIIDLIEVGDYVNGKLVEDIFDKTNYADKSIKLKSITTLTIMIVIQILKKSI